jgi:hypothetical protein
MFWVGGLIEGVKRMPDKRKTESAYLEADAEQVTTAEVDDTDGAYLEADANTTPAKSIRSG